MRRTDDIEGLDDDEVNRLFSVGPFHVQLVVKGGHVVESSCDCDYSGTEFVRSESHPMIPDSTRLGETVTSCCEHEVAALISYYSRYQSEIEFEVEEI
ncbi:hypothetical protein [Halosimplex halobium]|uniref:hypothetical protein n=1 Tax=Halosimplex halobium TaxID=3396618 RepID=UPI003F5566BE